MINVQTGTCGLGTQLFKNQATSRPDHLWPEMWSSMSKDAQRKEKQRWAVEKTEAQQCQKVVRHLLYCSGRKGVQLELLEFVPMHQAMKILDVKAAVGKEWEQLQKMPT